MDIVLFALICHPKLYEKIKGALEEIGRNPNDP